MYATPLADISWGSATNIAGDSDVDTTGTLVYAYNFGASFSTGSATVQTVNGVTFQPFGVDNNSGPVTNGSVTVEETNPNYYVAGDQVLSSTAAPFSGLNAGYQGLLATGMYASNFGSIRVDLGGLTPGSTYRLQWWTSDATVSTGTFAPYLEYFDSTFSSGASTSVTLDSNTSNVEGGLGQYVIGTFTASDSTASFLLTGTGNGSVSVNNFPLVNALQLRVTAVPEPSTYAMALAGLACGGFSMWRRRKRARNLVSFLDDRKEFRPMKSSQVRNWLTACGVLVLSILATRPGTTASAAPIVWGAAQNISSDSDVNTSGSLVYAYQFGASLTGTTTVNGVPFQPLNVPYEATTVTAGSITLTSTAAAPYYGVMYPYDGITSASAPFANLSVGYQSLLSSAIVSSQFDTNPGAPLLIELGGLTAGTSYLVQWWSCATDFLSPFQTVALGSPNVTLDSNTTNTAGGLGQYAIGTFTASSSSMTISLEGLTMNSSPFDSPTINALQVRAVPEPSTYAMALAGIACGGFSMWRRWKRA